MTTSGQSRRFDAPPTTSGLPQSTDIGRLARLVRFVPEGDIRRAVDQQWIYGQSSVARYEDYGAYPSPFTEN